MKNGNQQLKKFTDGLNKIVNEINALVVATIMTNDKINGTDLERFGFISTSKVLVTKAFIDSGFEKLYTEFVNGSNQIINDLKAIHKINKITASLNAIDKDILSKFMATDLKVFKGVSETAINEIYRVLVESVRFSTTQKQMVLQIQKVLDERLLRYADTYANTSRQLFYQKSEDMFAQQLKDDGEDLYWEYSGAEDAKNRDICIQALDQRFFTDTERQAFEDENGIRYNCRHIFMLITKESYDSKETPDNDMTDDEIERRASILEVMNG
jgi:hypothetical protein